MKDSGVFHHSIFFDRTLFPPPANCFVKSLERSMLAGKTLFAVESLFVIFTCFLLVFYQAAVIDTVLGWHRNCSKFAVWDIYHS